MAHFADEGVRQNCITISRKTLLTPGDKFYKVIFGEAILQEIPVGRVGIIHSDDKQISVVRDDCKAARKAIQQQNAKSNLC